MWIGKVSVSRLEGNSIIKKVKVLNSHFMLARRILIPIIQPQIKVKSLYAKSITLPLTDFYVLGWNVVLCHSELDLVLKSWVDRQDYFFSICFVERFFCFIYFHFLLRFALLQPERSQINMMSVQPLYARIKILKFFLQTKMLLSEAYFVAWIVAIHFIIFLVLPLLFMPWNAFCISE